MAALLIVGMVALAEKIERKKEEKRQKKLAIDEARYKELQVETERRLSRTQSGTIIEYPAEDTDDDEDLRTPDSVAPPPSYEDAVQAGERRERQWQAQMQRRRSSMTSTQSGGGSGAVRFMRMG